MQDLLYARADRISLTPGRANDLAERVSLVLSSKAVEDVTTSDGSCALIRQCQMPPSESVADSMSMPALQNWLTCCTSYSDNIVE